MARIKRTTRKLGTNSRATTTTSSKGTFTNSNSTKSGNVRTTRTTKSNGQSYTTQTVRYGDGSYERKRTTSYTPKTSKNMDNTAGGVLLVFILIAAALIATLF
jgi:cobalamin biosynthesis Mg chelatase CobN